MKRIQFSIIVSGLFFFLILPTQINAQDCSCSISSFTNPDPQVTSDSCPSGSVATCSVSGGSIYNLSTSCNCVESIPGETCVTTGQPKFGQTCCDGYYLGPYNQCVPEGVNPFQVDQTSQNSNTDIFGPMCNDGKSGLQTAIGCIHIFDGESIFLSQILTWAVGIGGGISFALMLVAGFMIMTAQGNPERLKAGQELLTSALAGLVLLIFSVFILKFIGVDILGLDKFGFNN